MISEEMIEKLANDELLMKLQDYLITYDVGPREKLKRSIVLTYFWIEEGEKFKELRRIVKQDDRLVWEHLNPYYVYWHKIKLICDGKELSRENLSKIDLDEILDFKNSVFPPDGN